MPIVITGMHASATSLVASLVDGLGVDLGERLLPADAHNPAGYFEDLGFVELQSRMLLAALPADDGGHPDWGWTVHHRLEPGALVAWRDTARAAVASRAAAGRRWGWKNPRTAVALEFWDGLLSDARYLIVYRYPWEVADSLQRLGAEVFLRNPHYAYEIWEYYNRRILEFVDAARDRCLLVSADALLATPDRLDGLLWERLGLLAPDGYTASRIDPDLFRARQGRHPLVTLLEAVRPRCLDLLRELDRRADLSSAGLWGGPPRAAWGPGSAGDPPALSVLVPCYNHGEFLLEAVASVEQACATEPLELVVVDDGSDEPWTLDVLAALSGLGYQVVRQEHRGLAAARNAGAAVARGDFLLPLDADNRLRPDFPSAARRVLDLEPEVGVVYGDHWQFGLRTGTVRVPDFDLPRLLRGNYIDACACLRRRVWEDCGGWDGRMPGSGWEDWDLWIGAADQGWRFHHLPKLGFDYRARPDSLIAACAREEVGMPLQEYIVRKHEAIYLRHLPELLRATQEAMRDTEAARHGFAEASSRRQVAEQVAAAAQRELAETHAREAEVVVALETAHAELGQLETERDRLYRELAAWRERLAAMEGTRAWRMRGRLLALRRGAAALRRGLKPTPDEKV